MVTEEMIEHMGGPAGIADALKAFEELDARFDAERPRFTEQYPDQWVAMTAGGLVVVADTLSGLAEQLIDKGIGPDDEVHHYMNTKPQTLVI